MRRHAATIVVLAILLASAVAFAETERLKLQPTPIQESFVQPAFSPVCACALAHAAIRIRLHRANTVTVRIRDDAGHTVRVEKNTLLHRICGTDELSVNSAHHQAVKAVGPGVVVDAVAPDGVIEVIAKEITRAARDTDFLARLEKVGVEPMLGTPQEFAKVIAADTEFWRDLVRELNLKGQ